MAQNTVNIYQFNVSIKRLKPKIWRRIQVPEDYSFFDLHIAIQDVFGWSDFHLHRFEFNKNREDTIVIGIPDRMMVGLENIVPEKTAKISEYFLSPKDKASYEYDFGDPWDHDVILEKILPAKVGIQYPQCTGGKIASPPEHQPPEDEPYDSDEDMLDDNPVDFDPKTVKFSNPEERWKSAFQKF